jgi:hypothetical protein
MDIQQQVKQIDALVTKGAMVEAINRFFDANAKTSDFSGVKTQGRAQMVEKMEGFLDAIAAVRGITHHNSLALGNTSTSEFTFDFEMKDGSNILWHEIIKRQWNEAGKIIAETYFKA